MTQIRSIISSSIYHRKCIFWLLWLVCLRQRAYCHIPHISHVCTLGATLRDKKGWTQRLGLANVSPKGLYHGIRGWFKLDSGS